MLGHKDGQGALFRADHVYREHVGRESFYGILGEEGGRRFRDEDFVGLYRSGGRPSVPPSQLCVALLLQVHDGVSDAEAIARSAYDLRWKVALGLEMDEKLCAKSTLQLFRAKLVVHEAYGRIFETSVAACRRAGLKKRAVHEVAIDTTPILGRGAVKDTYNLISDGIRAAVREISRLKQKPQGELVSEAGLERHFGTSFKGECDLDWSDKEARRALVGELVADARQTLELCSRAMRGHRTEVTASLREARKLLSELLLQDIEEDPEDGQGPRIRQGTTKDRIVSTTDPEMRHGHKSHSKGFEGYKASVVCDANGVIVATRVQPANEADGAHAAELIDQASETMGTPIKRALGDTAYGNMDVRETLQERDIEVVAKAPPAPRRADFTHEDFTIDAKKGVARCPAGKRSIRRDRVGDDGFKYVFSRRDCTPCPLRTQCTTGKVAARMITVNERSAALTKLRRHQKTKGFKQRYRRRIVVEHGIGRLIHLGLRHARCFGKAKTACQTALTATVANLMLAVATCRSEQDSGRGARQRIARIASWIRFVAVRLQDVVSRLDSTALDPAPLEMATSRPDL